MTRKLPWLTLLLAALVLAVSAAGCGGEEAAPPAEEEPAAEEEPIRVGLVTDIGGLDDKSFNMLANKGLEDAQNELGIEGRVLQSRSDADYVPNLSSLAQEGYDLIVSVGFLMGEVTEQVAADFPDTNFAIVDFAYEEPPPNLQGLVFKEQETGYLVGYLAGLVTETNVISAVGGQKIPPVDRFIAGYRKGAQDANPDANVLIGYSQDFVAQDKCKEIALQQIAQNSDIVFQVAGGCGLGALGAAQDEGVWGIGVDADQSHLGEHILTSAVKRVDVAVFKTIEAVQNGTFEGGGVSVFGLEDDGVGLGDVSSRAPEDAVEQTREQIDRIINGEIEIPETV